MCQIQNIRTEINTLNTGVLYDVYLIGKQQKKNHAKHFSKTGNTKIMLTSELYLLHKRMKIFHLQLSFTE